MKKKKNQKTSSWRAIDWFLLGLSLISVFISVMNLISISYVEGYLDGMKEFMPKVDANERDLKYEDSMLNYLNSYNETGLEYYNNYSSHFIEGCEDDYCKAYFLFYHLANDYGYEVGEDINPMHTIQNGSGDCDEMTMLYMVLLKSINISSESRCTQVHCWTRVFYDGKMVEVDVVQNKWDGVKQDE